MLKRWMSLRILAYLRLLARWQLKKFAPDIIGITGSAGKTSTRNAVAAVLKEKYRIKVSYRANSESGIPLNILGITPGDLTVIDWVRMVILAPWKLLTNWEAYEKYVVEMGIDSPKPPKNMTYLLTIVQPRTGIFLNAMTVHSEFFDILVSEKKMEKREKIIAQKIAAEKGKLIESLPENGLAILNADDANVIGWRKRSQAPVMTFGTDKRALVRTTEWKVNKKGTTFGFAMEEERAQLTLQNQVLPEHYGSSLAAALCVALDEDYTLEEGVKLLANDFKVPPGRSSLLSGVKDSLIIDSSYNASPQPMADMLALLAKFPAKRRLALLGDMRELGKEALDAHTRLITLALTQCDQIILVGSIMRLAWKTVRETHLDRNFDRVAWHTNAVEAGNLLRKSLRKGDVLLVKGSQNTLYLEQAVEALLKDKADAKKLCRRGNYWDQLRSNAFHQNT